MAAVPTTTGTYLSNLFSPQVVGDMIDKKLTNLIRFAPLARVYDNLVGRPGNVISLPYYSYIGDAAVVAEGQDLSIAQLNESTTPVTIKKVAKGVQITDEAVLSAFGNPLDEAVSQLALSIASAVDNDVLNIMNTTAAAAMTMTAAAFTADRVAAGLTLYGEDIEGDKVLLVSPASYEILRKASNWIAGTDVGANIIVRGTVGMIYGCQVVVSNKLTTSDTAYIVKPGALALYNKRETFVETDRDIINKSTVITADRHYAAYLLDPNKLVKIPTT